MSEKAPSTRRKFSGLWDQIKYLYDKTFYWSYGQGNWRQAQRFADRLKRLVAKADPKSEALLGMSCRALIAEVDGDLRKAIRFRKREIDMIRRLSQLDVPEGARLDLDELSDTLDLLAIHYWDLGDFPKALEILNQSKRYCAEHDIPFAGQDIVDGVRREMRAAASRNGIAAQRSGKRSY
jgi:hypothetical protein